MKPTLRPGDRITPETAKLLKVGDKVRLIRVFTVGEISDYGIRFLRLDCSCLESTYYSFSALPDWWTFHSHSPRKSPAKKKDNRRVAEEIVELFDGWKLRKNINADLTDEVQRILNRGRK